MLGNWSLGDYFKKEMIPWSYEFLTGADYLHIPADKLAVTVFAGDETAPRDDEAAETLGKGGHQKRKYLLYAARKQLVGTCGLDGTLRHGYGNVRYPQAEMFADVQPRLFVRGVP